MENLFVKQTTSSTVTLQFDPVLKPLHRVRSYRVQNLKTNEVKEVAQGLQAFSPPKVITFSGLNNGTRYTFRAASVNPSGPSVWINVTAITSGRKYTALLFHAIRCSAVSSERNSSSL